MPISPTIEFTNPNHDSVDLVCPRCGGFNLHHVGVRMYERSEDQPTVTLIETYGDRVKVTPRVSSDRANPSSRRHGMVVMFDCELCNSPEGEEDRIELRFAQHKGSTEVSWFFTHRDPKELER